MKFKKGDMLIYLGGSRWEGYDGIAEGQLFEVARIVTGSCWISRKENSWYHDPKYFILAKEHLFNKLYLTLKDNQFNENHV